MDYEKKYKEALEWARKVMQGKVGFVLDEVLEKFPELKESENEKIREELIEQVAYIIPNDDEVDSEGNILPTHQKRIDKYRAWIEKQGRKKPSWSEEDNVRFTSTIQVLEFAHSLDSYNQYGKKDIRDNLTWLKSLKDRVQPQPKQEWSEEDELTSKTLTALVEMFYGGYNNLAEKNRLHAWLKSLKDRYTWKPSYGQMGALEHFVRSIGESGYASPYDNNTKLLYSLLSDLKKLKE